MSNKQKIVITALENSKYKWRTVKGIAKEAKISEPTVLQTISELKDKGFVIRSSIPASNGEELYTTRKHYKETSTTSDRIFAAIRNRVA